MDWIEIVVLGNEILTAKLGDRDCGTLFLVFAPLLVMGEIIQFRLQTKGICQRKASHGSRKDSIKFA